MKKQNFNPSRAPLFDALVTHLEKQPASFHIPGHKSGQGVDPMADDLYKAIMSIDLTELTELDDLHQPAGVIEQAQQLAAQCFGAKQSFFLVGGSTVGNLAMILSVCERGDTLLVQRNSHKSVIHGLKLAGVRTVFLSPEWNIANSMASFIPEDDVHRAIMQYPEAKGLLLTNPNYYGMSQDLTRIADLLHRKGKILMVDEAHGAHFSFHPRVPISALACGADIVVQSTHKMLTSLTMGGLLHIQGERVNPKRIQTNLSILQSSSPSYPILASIDLARKQMQNEGEIQLQQGLSVVDSFCKEVKTNYPWFGLTPDLYDTKLCVQDPFKVLLSDLTGTLPGNVLKTLLEKHNCFVELSTDRFVLLVFTLSSNAANKSKLLLALDMISKQYSLQKKELVDSSANKIPNQVKCTISLPVHMDIRIRELVEDYPIDVIDVQDIDQAVGRIIAEDIIPYPPGIPICFCGEPLTSQIAQQIKLISQQLVYMQGTTTSQFTHVRLFRSFR